MLFFVLICNLLITLINLIIALQLWRLRKKLAKVTLTLTLAEKRIDYLLYAAQPMITQGQKRANHFRKLYRQIQQLQRVVILFNLVYKVWQGRMTRPTKMSSIN